jgi:hypothetical protein
MGGKRTKDEKDASRAPSVQRNAGLKEAGHSYEQIYQGVSGAAAAARGDSNPLTSQWPSQLRSTAAKRARAEASEAAAVSTLGTLGRSEGAGEGGRGGRRRSGAGLRLRSRPRTRRGSTAQVARGSPPTTSPRATAQAGSLMACHVVRGGRA